MHYQVTTLAEPRYPSPLNRFVDDDLYVPEHIVRGLPAQREEPLFELAGPRERLFFDPSHFVRSGPANSEDSILCDLFARNAVHAAMAGKTGLVIGFLHDEFIHVPIELLASRRWTATERRLPEPSIVGRRSEDFSCLLPPRIENRSVGCRPAGSLRQTQVGVRVAYFLIAVLAAGMVLWTLVGDGQCGLAQAANQIAWDAKRDRFAGQQPNDRFAGSAAPSDDQTVVAIKWDGQELWRALDLLDLAESNR